MLPSARYSLSCQNNTMLVRSNGEHRMTDVLGWRYTGHNITRASVGLNTIYQSIPQQTSSRSVGSVNGIANATVLRITRSSSSTVSSLQSVIQSVSPVLSQPLCHRAAHLRHSVTEVDCPGLTRTRSTRTPVAIPQTRCLLRPLHTLPTPPPTTPTPPVTGLESTPPG